jgi:hypothetical protein
MIVKDLTPIASLLSPLSVRFCPRHRLPILDDPKQGSDKACVRRTTAPSMTASCGAHE